MPNLISRIFRSGKCTNNQSQDRLSAPSDLEQSKIALNTLLLFADRLKALMLHVRDLLHNGHLNREIELVKTELNTLEKQFSQLSPLVLSYKQNTIDKIHYDLISADLAKNLETLETSLKSSDIVTREFNFGYDGQTKGALIFVNGLADKDAINNSIMRPLMHNTCYTSNNDTTHFSNMDDMQKKLLPASDVKKIDQFSHLLDNLMSGGTILLVDRLPEALVVNARKSESRGVEEPESERVIRGPRDGFTESLQTNLSLIRKKISSPDLYFKTLELGTLTKTQVCIGYIEGVVNTKILAELEKRLTTIEIDGILDSGYIQEWIKDSPLSAFKTIGNTERPDIVAAKLLEGRITLIVNGSPSALTLPFLFIEYFQSNEDYYNNFIFSTFNRLLRSIAFFITTSLPAIYLSIVAFHQEMLPTLLLLSISGARQDVPFPTVVETLIMGLAFELLREGGTRMPLAIGQAISIVGALVLGDAAVSARLVSAPMVIVTALTGIAAFLLPKMTGALILVRLFFILLSSLLGLYGYIMGVIALVVYLMSMRSFGVPYMLTVAPLDVNDIKDTSVRAPWWLMNYRPKLITANRIRQTGAKAHGRR